MITADKTAEFLFDGEAPPENQALLSSAAWTPGPSDAKEWGKIRVESGLVFENFKALAFNLGVDSRSFLRRVRAWVEEGGTPRWVSSLGASWHGDALVPHGAPIPMNVQLDDSRVNWSYSITDREFLVSQYLHLSRVDGQPVGWMTLQRYAEIISVPYQIVLRRWADAKVRGVQRTPRSRPTLPVGPRVARVNHLPVRVFWISLSAVLDGIVALEAVRDEASLLSLSKLLAARGGASVGVWLCDPEVPNPAYSAVEPLPTTKSRPQYVARAEHRLKETIEETAAALLTHSGNATDATLGIVTTLLELLPKVADTYTARSEGNKVRRLYRTLIYDVRGHLDLAMRDYLAGASVVRRLRNRDSAWTSLLKNRRGPTTANSNTSLVELAATHRDMVISAHAIAAISEVAKNPDSAPEVVGALSEALKALPAGEPMVRYSAIQGVSREQLGIRLSGLVPVEMAPGFDVIVEFWQDFLNDALADSDWS
jgi:hypothetical protein